jgi:putative Mn2+ efflux pump MntP
MGLNYPTVLLVSVALGIDAFSVALGLGLMGVRLRDIALVSGAVSVFHVVMPLIGLSLGAYLGQIAGPVASMIGALVLLAIGLNTIWDSLKEAGLVKSGRTKTASCGDEKGTAINLHHPLSLAAMACSVSLDALSVGFGLGTIQVDLWLTVLTMGVVAGLMTAVGLFCGKGLHKAAGEKAGILAGLILVGIGLKLLFS